MRLQGRYPGSIKYAFVEPVKVLLHLNRLDSMFESSGVNLHIPPGSQSDAPTNLTHYMFAHTHIYMFLSFSVLALSIYIVTDIFDTRESRSHLTLVTLKDYRFS